METATPAMRRMIDLHCHMLNGIDDGARDVEESLAMARLFVADGVSVVACTPHILPGRYDNSGLQIRTAVAELQERLAAEGIPLTLVAGADNRIVPDFVAGLRAGRLLTLADTRYVLVEPPHHAAPPRMEEQLVELLAAGFVPVVTHPERLSWLYQAYDEVKELVRRGVWIQITAASLTGGFGRQACYWATKLLDEGCVHLIATDAHDTSARPPALSAAFSEAATRLGETEATNLVLTRPQGILDDVAPATLPLPPVALEKPVDPPPRVSGWRRLLRR
jgi:protein-tyrosine phosphatase